MMVESLPVARQRRLHAAHWAEAEAALLGADWHSFRASMEKLRRAGHAISLGELEPQNVGVAAPIAADGALPAALVLVLGRQRFEHADAVLLVRMVMRAAAGIAAALDPTTMPAVPARRRLTA